MKIFIDMDLNESYRKRLMELAGLIKLDEDAKIIQMYPSSKVKNQPEDMLKYAAERAVNGLRITSEQLKSLDENQQKEYVKFIVKLLFNTNNHHGLIDNFKDTNFKFLSKSVKLEFLISILHTSEWKRKDYLYWIINKSGCFKMLPENDKISAVVQWVMDSTRLLAPSWFYKELDFFYELSELERGKIIYDLYEKKNYYLLYDYNIFNSLTAENKKFYTNKLSKIGDKIPDFIFDLLNPQELSDYIHNLKGRIPYSMGIGEHQFNNLPNELKRTYVVNKIRASKVYKLTQQELSSLTPDEQEKFKSRLVGTPNPKAGTHVTF